MNRGGTSHRERGFSLIEILVALMLGLALLAAFISVVAHCRAQFAAQESIARLQDNARQALSAMVPDIEAAGGYGFTHAPRALVERGGAVLAEDAELRQPTSSAAVPPARGLPAGSHDCGINFAVDLAVPVQASNDVFALGASASDCIPTASADGARAGSDTLTIRRASTDLASPHAGRVQIYSRRFSALAELTLLGDGLSPGSLDTDHELRDLEVRTYYVANSSVDRPGWPALRVKALTESRGNAQFRDEEILPGVEDLQVELAVARREAGMLRVRYVAPDSPEARTQSIIAVRIWLRLRADSTERGFLDSRELRYADHAFNPDAFEATQRRLLVERTVALRNPVTP